MNDNMRYSDRLMRLIEILNLDSKQISKETGFSRSTVYSLVSGKPKKPSDGFLNAMAEKYGVCTRWLLSGEGPIFLPGRFPIDYCGNVATDELRNFEMANFLTENLSLPPACRNEVLVLANKLVTLKDSINSEMAAEAEEELAPQRRTAVESKSKTKKHCGGASLSDTELPGKTIRLRKRYSKHKARNMLQRQSIMSRATVKMKESKKLLTGLTEFILSEHDNILAVKNLKLVDCILHDIHRQAPQEDTYLVETDCQFEFTGTLKKENGASEREFGIVVEISCCVTDRGQRFKSAYMLTKNIQYSNHEIFYAIDTELGKERKKDVSVSGAVKMLERRQQALQESNSHTGTLVDPGEIAWMEE